MSDQISNSELWKIILNIKSYIEDYVSLDKKEVNEIVEKYVTPLFECLWNNSREKTSTTNFALDFGSSQPEGVIVEPRRRPTIKRRYTQINIEEFGNLDVKLIPNIGEVKASIFEAVGVKSIGDLISHDPDLLAKEIENVTLIKGIPRRLIKRDEINRFQDAAVNTQKILDNLSHFEF